MSKIIAPSILSADFSRLGDDIRAVANAGADWIHVDVMDGHFVPNITIGPMVVEAIRRVTELPIDVHLMIENPDQFIPLFAKAGANTISVHVEEGYHLDRTIQLIRDCGVKPAVVLNPATPVSSIEHVLDNVDMVLLMTVNPGFGGQKFIGYCKKKISQLKKLIQSRPVLIEVDGGVTVNNIGELAQLGADVFVAGSAIFGSKSYKETITQMKKEIE